MNKIKSVNFKNIYNVINIMILLLFILIKLNIYTINLNIVHTKISLIILSTLNGFLIYSSNLLQTEKSDPPWNIIYSLVITLLWFKIYYFLLAFVAFKVITTKSHWIINTFTIFILMSCLTFFPFKQFINNVTLFLSLQLLVNKFRENKVTNINFKELSLNSLVCIITFISAPKLSLWMFVIFMLVNLFLLLEKYINFKKIISTIMLILFLDIMFILVTYQIKLSFDKTYFDYSFVILSILVVALVLFVLLVFEMIMIIISSKVKLYVDKVKIFSYNIKEMITILLTTNELFFKNFTSSIMQRKIITTVQWRYRAH